MYFARSTEKRPKQSIMRNNMTPNEEVRDPGLEAELTEASEKASAVEPDKFLGRSQEHSSDEPEHN